MFDLAHEQGYMTIRMRIQLVVLRQSSRLTRLSIVKTLTRSLTEQPNGRAATSPKDILSMINPTGNYDYEPKAMDCGPSRK